MIDAAAIAALVASPSTIARCGRPNSGTEKPSKQAQHLARDVARDSRHRVAQRRDVRPVQAPRVDAAHAARDDDHAGRAAQHQREQLLARLGGVLLGVVQRAQRAQLARGQRVVVEQHAGGDQRTRQAAAPRLVGPRHERHPESSVEGEQSPSAALAPRSATGASPRRGRPTCAAEPRAGALTASPSPAQRMPMRSGGQ